MSMDDFIKTLTEEQKQALLKALSGGEVSEKPFTDTSKAVDGSVEDVEVEENFKVVREPTKFSKSKEPVRARENTWADTGEDRHIETPKSHITPRTRKAPAKKTVKCHACGKTEKVNAGLVFGEYYRCDRCIG
tara:strand:- start:639 stop:1037 length:399 start_codon:yes stop_codon:yes gene_type:complete